MATADLPQLNTLTPEAKRALLGALLVDLSASADKLGPVEADGRRFYIYTPPPDAREMAERAMRECPPEYRAELQRRAAESDSQLMSVEEVLRIIPEEAERLIRSQQSSGSARE
jgi:hypothetical protein